MKWINYYTPVFICELNKLIACQSQGWYWFFSKTFWHTNFRMISWYSLTSGGFILCRCPNARLFYGNFMTLETLVVIIISWMVEKNNSGSSELLIQLPQAGNLLLSAGNSRRTKRNHSFFPGTLCEQSQTFWSKFATSVRVCISWVSLFSSSK